MKLGIGGNFNLTVDATPEESAAFLVALDASKEVRADLLELMRMSSPSCTDDAGSSVIELTAVACTCGKTHRRFAVSRLGGRGVEFAIRCDDTNEYAAGLAELVLAVVNLPAHPCTNCNADHESVALALSNGSQVNLDTLCAAA